MSFIESDHSDTSNTYGNRSFTNPKEVARLVAGVEANHQSKLLRRLGREKLEGDIESEHLTLKEYNESVARHGKLTAISVDDVLNQIVPNGQYAIRLPEQANVCTLPDGTQTSFYKAMKAGYELIDAYAMAVKLGYIGDALQETTEDIKRNLSAVTRSQRDVAYVAAIFNLPEARQRPKAAALVATSYCGSWSIERAAAFLRGLPVESANADGTNPTKPAALNTERMQRRVELRMAALATRMGQGDQSVRDERNALAYALDMVRHGSSIVTALQQVELDPVQFS